MRSIVGWQAEVLSPSASTRRVRVLNNLEITPPSYSNHSRDGTSPNVAHYPASSTNQRITTDSAIHAFVTPLLHSIAL